MFTVYVLELEQEKYFVGLCKPKVVTSACLTDLKQLDFVKTYPIKRVLYTTRCHDMDESTTVHLDVVRRHGIDNVRGFLYISMDISDHVRARVEHKLRTHSYIHRSQQGVSVKKTLKNFVKGILFSASKPDDYSEMTN